MQPVPPHERLYIDQLAGTLPSVPISFSSFPVYKYSYYSTPDRLRNKRPPGLSPVPAYLTRPYSLPGNKKISPFSQELIFPPPNQPASATPSIFSHAIRAEKDIPIPAYPLNDYSASASVSYVCI